MYTNLLISNMVRKRIDDWKKAEKQVACDLRKECHVIGCEKKNKFEFRKTGEFPNFRKNV